MSLRLHMCLEHNDEHLFQKSFYVSTKMEHALFTANEGAKLLSKIMADEIRNFFEAQKNEPFKKETFIKIPALM